MQQVQPVDLDDLLRLRLFHPSPPGLGGRLLFRWLLVIVVARGASSAAHDFAT